MSARVTTFSRLARSGSYDHVRTRISALSHRKVDSHKAACADHSRFRTRTLKTYRGGSEADRSNDFFDRSKTEATRRRTMATNHGFGCCFVQPKDAKLGAAEKRVIHHNARTLKHGRRKRSLAPAHAVDWSQKLHSSTARSTSRKAV